jgi:hypothetical protein
LVFMHVAAQWEDVLEEEEVQRRVRARRAATRPGIWSWSTQTLGSDRMRGWRLDATLNPHNEPMEKSLLEKLQS